MRGHDTAIDIFSAYNKSHGKCYENVKIGHLL